MAALAFPALADEGQAKTTDQPWENRVKPWEATDLSNGGVGIEEESVGALSGNSLKSTWEGIKGSPQYQNIESLVDNNEQMLMDMENRISALENMGPSGNNDLWIEEPETIGSGGTSGASTMSQTPWEPPFEDQRDDFTQSAQFYESRSNPVEVYEYNPSTGERRLKESYVEKKELEYEQVRTVNVQVTTEDVTETVTSTYYGYTFETEVPIKKSCVITPAPSTVDEGKLYTGSETCQHKVTETIKASAKEDPESAWSQWVTLGEKEEVKWESRTTTGNYYYGTRPVTAPAPECVAYDSYNPGNYNFSWSQSFGIISFRWGSMTNYHDSGSSSEVTRGHPTRQHVLRKSYAYASGPGQPISHYKDDGYDYWVEGDPYARNKNLCRTEKKWNDQYRQSVLWRATENGVIYYE